MIGAANKTNINPLEQVQKRFFKIIYNRSFLYPTELLYNESEFFNIRQIYCESILKQVVYFICDL